MEVLIGNLAGKYAIIEDPSFWALQGLFWPEYTSFGVGWPSVKGSNRSFLAFFLVGGVAFDFFFCVYTNPPAAGYFVVQSP